MSPCEAVSVVPRPYGFSDRSDSVRSRPELGAQARVRAEKVLPALPSIIGATAHSLSAQDMGAPDDVPLNRYPSFLVRCSPARQ
jgi:hypothetical protein